MAGSRSDVGGAHIQAFTLKLPQDHGPVACGAHIRAFTFLLTKTLSRSRSVVWCCVVVCCVVVWCCVVCCGGACVWCVVKLGTLSLSLSLALSPFFSLSLSFSLLTFFFFFFFSCSFAYSCSCSCSFSFSSFFFLPFYSLFSSLPFTPTNTVQSTDQQTRRPTLRRLNVIWRRASAQQSVLSLLPSPPPSSEKRRGLFIAGIFPARELLKNYSLN